MSTVDLILTNHQDMSITADSLTLPASAPSVTADATVEINGISAAKLQKVFFYKVDTNIASAANVDNVKYFVDVAKWTAFLTDIDPSLKIGGVDANANPTPGATTSGFFHDNAEDIARNFLRHMADELFGTHLGVDLFNNETDVRKDIEAKLLSNVAQPIVDAVTSVDKANGSVAGMKTDNAGTTSGFKYLDDDETGTVNITRELFNQLAGNDVSNDRFNANSLSGYRYLTDSLNTNNGPSDLGTGVYSIPLIENDSISYKVTINPAATQDTDVAVGQTGVTARSYRVKLNLSA